VSLSAIPKDLRARIFMRDGGRCQYCRLMQWGQAALFHIDHIRPKSKGGPTVASNLALQCGHCSLHKANKVRGIDPTNQTSVRLFHPLGQSWRDHFALQRNGLCRGKTAIGRATIQAMRMNDVRPRVARKFQIRLGLLLPSE
jgi:5-methylcytosine-specific restriction endonuclease McrA